MFKAEIRTFNMLKKKRFHSIQFDHKTKTKNIHTAPTGYAFLIMAIGEVH